MNVRDIWSYENFGDGPLVTMPTSVHEVGDYGTDGFSTYRNASPDVVNWGAWSRPGPPGITYTDRLWAFNWAQGTGGMAPGLLMTWRLVLDQPVYDGQLWVATSWTDPLMVFNMPPAPPEPPLGSFDGDQNVDEIDIDLLADAIRTGSINFALFDISADGTTAGTDGAIDINDLDYLVRFLVDTTMGVGTGSEYGDFNLDGLVDTTDLTRLATYFGPGSTWAQGNANRNIDLMIDTTDLTILGTYFGFDASVDVIPEPMTLSLLAMGSLAILRRKHS